MVEIKVLVLELIGNKNILKLAILILSKRFPSSLSESTNLPSQIAFEIFTAYLKKCCFRSARKPCFSASVRFSQGAMV